jgi:hypothetical protein
VRCVHCEWRRVDRRLAFDPPFRTRRSARVGWHFPHELADGRVDLVGRGAQARRCIPNTRTGPGSRTGVAQAQVRHAGRARVHGHPAVVVRQAAEAAGPQLAHLLVRARVRRGLLRLRPPRVCAHPRGVRRARRPARGCAPALARPPAQGHRLRREVARRRGRGPGPPPLPQVCQGPPAARPPVRVRVC